MNPEKRELIQEWYRKAEQDLEAAEILVSAVLTSYDVVAFHAQQCAEKYLKSYLVLLEQLPPKVHDIGVLITLVSEQDASFENLRSSETLSKYAVYTRYPNDFEVDSKEQAEKLLMEAKSVKDFVRNKIGI
jgi:HEPN domain-containing protein